MTVAVLNGASLYRLWIREQLVTFVIMMSLGHWEANALQMSIIVAVKLVGMPGRECTGQKMMNECLDERWRNG
jgi:hypothetical protein